MCKNKRGGKMAKTNKRARGLSQGRGGGMLTQRLTPHMYTSRTRLPNPRKISKAGSCHTSFPCESSIRQSHTAQIWCERQERTEEKNTRGELKKTNFKNLPPARISEEVKHIQTNEIMYLFPPPPPSASTPLYLEYLGAKCSFEYIY